MNIEDKSEDMESEIPEKEMLLKKLKKGKFNVPDFICVPSKDFKEENFTELEAYLERHKESFKVIARSSHPHEESFKGGTFDSLETYADVAGIIYARNKIINNACNYHMLSIKRQQRFNSAPKINLDEMGIIVMPFIEGQNVMAKKLENRWEYGYCGDTRHQLHSEPYITYTPHDTRLHEISEQIQKYLGFTCEIEYVMSEEGDIYVVQAKDISHIEILEKQMNLRSIKLDGIRRVRRRRNYRERSIFVMDTKAFYLSLIDKCEDMVHGWGEPKPTIKDLLNIIEDFEAELEEFALRYHRFAVLGISIAIPEDLYQIANNYLDEMPELQKQLSKALSNNLYKRDYFISEADTLIAKDKIRVNLGSHNAYGIDTVRIPLWSIFWRMDRHKTIINDFKRLGFKTGDTIGIDVDSDDIPMVYRL